MLWIAESPLRRGLFFLCAHHSPGGNARRRISGRTSTCRDFAAVQSLERGTICIGPIKYLIALKENQAPLPGKIAALLRESRWFALLAGAAYLVLILVTFSESDPGWSHASTDPFIRNAGGRVGAWMADLLLYLFGLSAYWWVLLLVYTVLWGYRRLDGNSIRDRRPFLLALAGFAILLVASTGVEALRFYSVKAALPMAPGGMSGAIVGNAQAFSAASHG